VKYTHTILFIIAFLLQSCCAPNSCRYATSGSAALAPAIGAIENFKERNGKYPVVLDDIKPGAAAAFQNDLIHACPECSDLEYHTDAYGFELKYQYRHMGPNWCSYTMETEKWNCKGNY